jgi:hypothetical protein
MAGRVRRSGRDRAEGERTSPSAISKKKTTPLSK